MTKLIELLEESLRVARTEFDLITAEHVRVDYVEFIPHNS